MAIKKCKNNKNNMPNNEGDLCLEKTTPKSLVT